MIHRSTVLGLLFALLPIVAVADDTPREKPAAAKPAPAKPATPVALAKPVALNKKGTVLLDKPAGKLLLKTTVVLQNGVLEMLLCKKGTKEHESIVAIDALAREVKVGLIAIGAKAGSPVRFDPEFTPPTGSKLEIHAVWTDAKGKSQRVPAQSWIRSVTRRYFIEKIEGGLPKGMKPIPETSEMRFDAKHSEFLWFGPMSKADREALFALSEDAGYREVIQTIFERSQIHPMEAEWVFAGSGTFVDENGDEFFQAESGDVICVANFPTALVDVAQKSSSDGEGNLLYEAWSERVPPLGTAVTLEITLAKPAAKPAVQPTVKPAAE